MKNFLLFLSLFLMFLLGARDVNAALPVEEGIGVEYVLQADVPTDRGDAYMDTESFTGQWRISGRGQRPSSVQHLSFGKSLAYRSTMKHQAVLFHSITGVYTSLPIQSWSLSSDHYVFGMRRILI